MPCHSVPIDRICDIFFFFLLFLYRVLCLKFFFSLFLFRDLMFLSLKETKEESFR